MPTDDEDIAKSRMLDAPYPFTYGPNGDVVETGRTPAELRVISEQIKSGKGYAFPAEELAGVLEVWRQTKQTTRASLG